MVEDFERLCWIRWRAGGADKVALIRGLDPLAEHIQGVRVDFDCWFGGNEEVGLVCVVHGFTAAKRTIWRNRESKRVEKIRRAAWPHRFRIGSTARPLSE